MRTDGKTQTQNVCPLKGGQSVEAKLKSRSVMGVFDWCSVDGVSTVDDMQHLG